jgi:ComF family protein
MATQFCQECHETPRPWAQGRAALLYQDRGRHLVLALKHGDRMDIADPVGHWLARLLSEFDMERPILLPIPLHPLRHVQRRYNQADLLARATARASETQVLSTGLERTKFTRPLEKASYEDRFERLSGAITVNPKADIAGRDVVLIDDVMTSGATLSAATEACLAANASRVCVLALARAVKSD